MITRPRWRSGAAWARHSARCRVAAMRFRGVFLIGAILLLLTSGMLAQRAVFVVRHAEKASPANEPSIPLSAAGSERARRLADFLRDTGISAIYSTDTPRTRGTVEPLAKRLGL